MVETRLELPDEVAVLQEMVRSQTRHYEERGYGKRSRQDDRTA